VGLSQLGPVRQLFFSKVEIRTPITFWSRRELRKYRPK